MKEISENGYSLEDLLKNVTDENIHPEISTLNEDEILVALSKAPGTDDILSQSEKAKYLKRIKKLIRDVDKHPLQFNCTAQEIRDLNRK
jgi:predicted esterase YcpF (UPF0227 family)